MIKIRDHFVKNFSEASQVVNTVEALAAMIVDAIVAEAVAEKAAVEDVLFCGKLEHHTRRAECGFCRVAFEEYGIEWNGIVLNEADCFTAEEVKNENGEFFPEFADCVAVRYNGKNPMRRGGVAFVHRKDIRFECWPTRRFASGWGFVKPVEFTIDDEEIFVDDDEEIFVDDNEEIFVDDNVSGEFFDLGENPEYFAIEDEEIVFIS